MRWQGENMLHRRPVSDPVVAEDQELHVVKICVRKYMQSPNEDSHGMGR